MKQVSYDICFFDFYSSSYYFLADLTYRHISLALKKHFRYYCPHVFMKYLQDIMFQKKYVLQPNETVLV